MEQIQNTPAIHAAFNPCVIIGSPTLGELTGTLEVHTDNGIITKSHEFFNGVAQFDLSSLLKKLFVDVLTELNPELNVGANKVYDDKNLFVKYHTESISEDGWDIGTRTALNAVVQLGQSSDLSFWYNKFLTKFNRLKYFQGFPQNVNILSEIGVKVHFESDDQGDMQLVTTSTDVQDAVISAPIAFDALAINQTYIRKILNYIHVNETSNLYGFGTKAINLVAGRAYIFSVSGKYNGLEGHYLNCILHPVGDWSWQRYCQITSPLDTIASIQFVAPTTGDYEITSVYYPQYGDRTGSATTNWYMIEESALLDQKPVDICILPENPFYVRWINAQAGYDYWMFGYRQFFTRSVTGAQTFKPYVLNQQTATAFEDLINIEGIEKVKVGAGTMTANEFECVSRLIYSPKIEWWNTALQVWQRILIDKGDSENDTHDTLKEIELSFVLPTPQLQF